MNDEHVDTLDFLVVDVETTGLSAERGDRVCEVAAVKLRGGAVMDTFSTLVDPQRPISGGAFAVNNISPQMLVDAPIFPEIAERLRALLENSVLVAYNAPFDLSFLQTEFQLSGAPRIKNPVVDALALARQLLPGLQRYTQENVARALGIPFPVRHRALEDTMVTARLFTMLSSMLKAYGCSTLADLRRTDLARALNAHRLTIVRDALGTGSDLWIKYFSPLEAGITDRVITPKECITGKYGKGEEEYLIGFCHSARAERNFRIDRILDLRIVRKEL
ncbi:MAG TPA: exonuclease domain-containing protein [Bacteroidota bacterium]|nr:exonuclease domain-containing protein [Bacteroidota bacterium]